MYVKTICPTCGEPVCADLLIREKVFLHSTEIIDVQALDTCTASELARDVIGNFPATPTMASRKLNFAGSCAKSSAYSEMCCDIIQ